MSTLNPFKKKKQNLYKIAKKYTINSLIKNKHKTSLSLI